LSLSFTPRQIDFNEKKAAKPVCRNFAFCRAEGLAFLGMSGHFVECGDYIICKSRADDKHEFSLLKGNGVFFEERMTNAVAIRR
jgi:hypothetical protein